MRQLDIISTILFVCKDIVETKTSVFEEDFTAELKPLLTGVNIELLDLYKSRLYELKVIYEKLQKYPTYFTSFYNSEVISNEDALEYHIHSFLADVYTYREKIAGLLGLMQNKIPAEYVEDKRSLDDIRKIILNNFEPITSIRKNHTHPITDMGWYSDEGSLKIRNIKALESFLNTEGIKETVNWDYVRERLVVEDAEAVKALEESVERWTKNSASALHMIEQTIPKILDKVSFTIYMTVNIADASELLKKRILTVN